MRDIYRFSSPLQIVSAIQCNFINDNINNVLQSTNGTRYRTSSNTSSDTMHVKQHAKDHSSQPMLYVNTAATLAVLLTG